MAVGKDHGGNELYNRKLRGTNVGVRVTFPQPIARRDSLKVAPGVRVEEVRAGESLVKVSHR